MAAGAITSLNWNGRTVDLVEQAAGGQALSVVFGGTTPSGASGVLQVGGGIVTVSTEMTRVADVNAYAANDVVSNNVTTTTIQQIAGCARVNGGSGYIVGIRLLTDKKSITPQIRVHLLNSLTSVVVAGDNVAYKAVYADILKRIGSYDLAAMSTAADATNSDYSGISDFTMRIPFNCAAGDTKIYFILETLSIFTPASAQKFTLELRIDQN